MRVWNAQIHTVGGQGAAAACATRFISYSLMQVKEIVALARDPELAEGLPKRKLSPVSRYLLDDLIRIYFEEYAPKGSILEKITIEDTMKYGI